MGGVETLFFRGDGRVRESAFNSIIVRSAAVAAAKVWPAIDPLASRSRWLDPAVVGDTHAAIAAGVRRCPEEGAALEGRDAPEQAARGRARRLRRFFGQPFFIVKAYTPRPRRARASCRCAGGLQGYRRGTDDSVPESAFHFAGGIAEVLARTAGEESP
jgi:F-type H+/Na+-transporting ATPase subunit beta